MNRQRTAAINGLRLLTPAENADSRGRLPFEWEK